MIARTPPFAVIAALALITTAAQSQPPRVAVTSETQHPARSRLVEELRAQGYDVQEEDRGEPAARATRDVEAGLSARLVMRAHNIEIRVVDRRGQHYERREAVIETGATEDDQHTAAMRAVEFLRAALIEVGTSAPKPQDKPQAALFPWETSGAQTPAPRPAPAAPASPERPSGYGVLASIGGGPIHSTGGIGTTGVIGGAIDFRLGGASGLRVAAALPVASSSLSGPEGSVMIKTTAVILTTWWSPLQGRWVRPGLELGIAAVFLGIASKPAPGYWAEDSTASTAVPVVGGGLSFLPGRVRLRVGVLTGPALRRIHLQFAGRETGAWGGWVTVPSASIEVGID
jgi:hypothetical protein